MDGNPQLHCPVRGPLNAKLKASDGLSYTEEKRRIECITLLLAKGYPADQIEAETTIIRIGHKGKNSLRADVVVYDGPTAAMKGLTTEQRRDRMKIVAEIKRNSNDTTSAKEEQLKPALALIPDTNTMGIYWDDVEQSLFIKEMVGTKVVIKEASIANLPAFGSKFSAADIHYKDLQPASNLTQQFSRLDDLLHQAGHPRDDRYDILFKILLLKIYDEQQARPKNGRMILQDFTLSDLPDSSVVKALQDEFGNALVVYGAHLPKKPTKTLGISGDVAREITKIICSINILGSSPQVLQDFFMYFGNLIYKADLAQYFTPYEVLDFIVKVVNPRFGDLAKDPACGTADFLVAAKRVAEERHGADISSQLYGVDASEMAVNLSVFNMILNGDGRSNITLGDSLKDIGAHQAAYTVTFCNPPFGTKIVERRHDVLKAFDLGHEDADPTKAVLKAQETGLLFVEVCVRSVKPGGRIGIILPNGYLGNRSPKYKRFRHWLLERCRIAAIVGFPRFTFKRAGADVSASVVVLEKIDAANPPKSEDYPIHFNLVNKVGWDLQSNRAGRVYRRNEADGTLVLDEANRPQLDADFDRVLGELYSSVTVDAFKWLATGVPSAAAGASWVVQASEVRKHQDLSLDPKRWSQKYHQTVASIQAAPHFKVSDVLQPVSRTLSKDASAEYRYVEIEQVYENFGSYIAQPVRGWALPGRARLRAAAGDVFIANIWSSAGKWLMAGDEAKDNKLIVTTGCTQFEVKPGAKALVEDLVFGLSSEAFRVQMRALSTGSDGLSSVSSDDILGIVLPKIVNANTRKLIRDRVAESKKGQLILTKVVAEELEAENPELAVKRRSSHVAQV